MKTARTVFVPFPGCISPSFVATVFVSAMIGNWISVFRLSFIHSVHFMCENTWSTLSPISSQFSALNFSYLFWNATNSVVQTGVKSAG